MAGRQLVGKLGVKVWPDTRGFKTDLRDKLREIEKSTKPIKVKVVVDLVKETLAATSAELEKFEKSTDISIPVRTSADRLSALATQIRLEQIFARSAISVAVKPVAEPTGIQVVKARLTAAFQKISARVVPVTAINEMAKVHKRLKEKFEKFESSIVAQYSAKAGAVVSTALVWLTRLRTVNIKPVLDSEGLVAVGTALAALSGARVVGDWFERMGDQLARLDRLAPNIAMIGTALAGVIGLAASATSNLFSMAASLASIAPLALVLPSMFASAGIGVGILIAAFKDFNTVLPGVRTQLAALQDTISASFWLQAAAPIQNMINTLLPAFSAGLAQTSGMLGTLFGNLATSLGESLLPALPSMFADLSAAIAIAATGTDGFANIIKILGQTGAGYLPRLSQFVVDLSNRFSDFLTAASADGRLNAWIDTAITALLDLGRVIGGIAGIFSGIAHAAGNAGGSTLTVLADTLQRVSDIVNSDAFQAGLVGVFAAAHQAMDKISTTAGPALGSFFDSLGSALERILPILGTTLGTALEAVAGGLAQILNSGGVDAIFHGLSEGIRMLAPAIPAVASAISSLAPIVGELLAAIGPLLGAALQAIAPLIMALAPVVMALVSPLKDYLLTAVTALAPVLSSLATQIGALLTAVLPLIAPLLDLVLVILQPLFDVILMLSETALPPLIEAIGGLVTALVPIIEMVSTVVGVLMDLLAPAIEFLASAITGGLTHAVQGLTSIFEGVWNIIMGIWNAWAGIFTGDWDRFWSGISQMFGGVWDVIKGLLEFAFAWMLGAFERGRAVLTTVWNAIWGGIVAAFNWAIDGIVDLATSWWDTFTSFWSGIGRFLKQCWDDAIEAVMDGVIEVVKFVRELPMKAAQAIKNIKDTLVNAGRDLIQGFIDGISAMFTNVKDTLGNLTDSLTSWKGPPDKDRVLLTSAGELIIQSLINGMESKYGAVKKSLRGLTGDIAGTDFAAPIASGMSGLAALAADSSIEGRAGNTLNYYAAPGRSISAEEDLFAALNRPRAMGWS